MSAKGALVRVPAYYGKMPAKENAGMKEGVKIDKPLALREHTDLINLLQMEGLSVRLIPPKPHLLSGVFVANIGWQHGDKALVSNFRNGTRDPERDDAYEWFQRLGFDPQKGMLRTLPTEPEEIIWEGQGDTLVGGKGHVFFTYGIRSDYAAKYYLQDMLNPDEKLVELELQNQFFYHGDTCVNTFKTFNLFIYYPAAFSNAALSTIENLPLDLIELSPFLANCLAANSIYIGKTFILNVPFDACEESRIKSARGEAMTENDVRFRELVEFEKRGWQNQELLTWKLTEQKIKNPFRTGRYGRTQKCGYTWLIRQLWDRGAEIIPGYMSQFEPHDAGLRCCVLFLDWLLENPNSVRKS